MNNYLNKSLKTLFISILSVLAIAFCTIAFIGNFTPVAKAEVLTSTEFKAIGSSVRIFKTTTDENGKTTHEKTDRQGIRFHVQMGSGYAYKGTTLIDTTQKNDFNGSFLLNENFKTYTLIIPTRLLNGELDTSTDKVMKLETSEYWHLDEYGNLESVAYVYNIPEKWYTDNFSYRGIICDANDNVLVKTDVLERNLTEIAKKAYVDTIDENTDYWGTKELDETAAPLIKEFIPKYSISYKINGVITTEEVLWGDAPQSAPTQGVQGAWYDTQNNEDVDVSAVMNWSEDRTLVLESSTAEDFVLTGVASQANFEVGDSTYHGVKVFATLKREDFANKTAMDYKAVKIEHLRGNTVINDNFQTEGVWTFEEQNSLGELGMRLFFAISDEARSTLQSGDKLLIKGESVFYANNVMYRLTEDYTVEYTKTNGVEDYGMFLGHLYNSDVEMITNCAEDPTGNNGKPTEFTLRVQFYNDVMVNGEFTFEFGDKSNWGDKTYPHPVYIQCGEDENKLIPISGGRYYWNEGNHKILELIGVGEYENKVFGWHNGDKLYGAPGTIIKQNGGYYVFEDEMYGYYLIGENDGVDQWGYALGNWVVGNELKQFATNEFNAEGSTFETSDYGMLSDELRINTASHWFGKSTVNILTVEKMDTSAPYAIYYTSTNGTVTEIENVRYHGQSKPEGGTYQILGLCGKGKFTVGDVITISAGTRFWLGVEYYTVTEKITYYFNGNYWIQNYDESTMGELSSANFEDRAHNLEDPGNPPGELRMYFTAPLNGYTTTDGGAFDELKIGTGSIKFNGHPVSYVRYQRWDAASTWLAIGGHIGTTAFGDKLVIEEGTTIWGPNKVAYKFTETVEWLYTYPNNPNNSYTWSKILDDVTINATTTSASINGIGTLAIGNDYTFNVSPDSGYLISDVTVNYESLPLNASNAYTFTVKQANTIVVTAIKGHSVTFSIPEGITVDGGAIENGKFKVVANGTSLTFSVSANEGYKLISVNGATNNGDGTYTVSNVTANKTISISVEKLYKVTYSGENASISANVANGAWVTSGTNITFTVSANSGYTLVGVQNTVKTNATTYTATVNGANLNVVATALANSGFVDITDKLQMEDRAWFYNEESGFHNNAEVYVGLLDMSVTNTVPNEDGTTSTNHYFNTSTPVNGTWYDSNDAIISANGGVDIMEYILVNGVSARKLITDNATGARLQNTGCSCWLSNPAAYPVYVETTATSGIMIRLAKDEFDTNFTITIKAGFRITNAYGDLVAVTNDINFTYTNGVITKAIDEGEVVNLTFNCGNGTLINDVATVNNTSIKIGVGSPYVFKVSAQEGYKITSVTGATDNGNGTYTITATNDVTVSITTEKLYRVTYANDNVTIDGNVSNGEWVENGTIVEFSVTANSDYTLIEVTNAEKLNKNTFRATVNGEDLTLNIVAFANNSFKNISSSLEIEDRSWGADDNEVYVGLLDMSVTNTVPNKDGTTSTNHYFNTSVNGTWYAGNDAIILANGGVDIMEYILVNGVSARKLITDNASGVKASYACECWLSNPAAYPVYVETTATSGIMIRLATAEFGTEFTITIKAGFRITDAQGNLAIVTNDYNFIWNEAKITKQDYWEGVALSNLKSNISDYTGRALSYNAATDTLNSVENCSQVTFSEELFEMLNYYGFSNINFELTVRANRTTVYWYQWKILKGEEEIFQVDNNQNYDKTINSSISEAITYSTYYRKNSYSEWQLDNESIWTIKNITIS